MLLGALTIFANQKGAGAPISLVRALGLGVRAWIVWIPLSVAIIHIGQRWPLDRGVRWRNVVLHLGAAAVVGVIAAMVSAVWVNDLRARVAFVEHVALRAPMASTLYFIILGVSYLAINTWKLRAQELYAERVTRELAEAQLNALRMQLQPHFLFNSLNAIMALVRDRATDRADHALTLLSDVLRTTLRHGAQPRVPLREEMQFIRDYLDIEALRFGRRLTVRYSIPVDTEDALVPTFVLQPLVENALLHGLANQLKGGTLEVASKAEGHVLMLTVSDDGAGLAADWEASSRNRVGLVNLRARLRHLYGTAWTLVVTSRSDHPGTQAVVTLPFEVVG